MGGMSSETPSRLTLFLQQIIISSLIHGENIEVFERIKDEALNAAGQFADAGKGFNLLSSPSLQGALTRALTLQAELRDHWDRRIQTVAKSLNLVSKRDVLQLKRHVRDLENLVATLEHQLQQQTIRTKKAETSLQKERRVVKAPSAEKTKAQAKSPAKKAAAKPKKVAAKPKKVAAKAKTGSKAKASSSKASAPKKPAKKAASKKAKTTS
jgi:hypothetical protein